jgi:hypothetical protein
VGAVHRILGLTAALSLTGVLTLPPAGLAAPPEPATPPGAAPVLPAVRAGDPHAERLTAALLDGPEAPAGFAAQPGATDDLFARIPHEIATCGKATGVPAGTVHQEYLRGPGDEELLIETLAAPGDRAARATVAALAGAAASCAAFTRPPGDLPTEMRFTVAKHPAPKLGDAAAGLAFVMKVPEMDLAVNGRLLAVATQGVTVTVALMTEGAPKSADLEAAARAAVTKVRNVRAA